MQTQIESLVRAYRACPSRAHTTRLAREVSAYAENVTSSVLRGRQLPRPITREDCVAAARAAAWQKLMTYDPDAAATYTSYAYLRVRGAVLDLLRRHDPLSRPERREAACAEDFRAYERLTQPRRPLDLDGRMSDGSLLRETLPGDDAPALSLWPELETLDARSRQVCLCRLRGMKNEAIAQRLGCTHVTVYNILKRLRPVFAKHRGSQEMPPNTAL